MNTFSVIFFHIMTFCAGGMTFINLAHFTPGAGEGYEYSWTNIWIFLVMGVAFSIATHLDRSR